MTDLLAVLGPLALASLQILAAALASAHAVLHKRSVHAAIGWVALIWLVPFGGAVLYALFGINRIRRRARELRRPPPSGHGAGAAVVQPTGPLPAELRRLAPIARLLDRVTGHELTAGNDIRIFTTGGDAYAAMLGAIRQAERSVGLATYVFDNDEVGREFARVLGETRSRGVEVRVLIDGVGVQYSYPQITGHLQERGIATSLFLPSLFPLYLRYANLRSHRKLLLIDGSLGFTGGMNIRRGHAETADPTLAITDLQFRVEGPVVGQMRETFIEDWRFASNETLAGDAWEPALAPAGEILARGIASGPDEAEAMERVRWAMQGALSQAQAQVRIVTPYFLPDNALMSELALAAMRGVSVDILIPEENNLRLVQWASLAKIGYLLARGCRVWRSPPPFDHAKAMTVDGTWSLIGSANWDQRSLRLNFEFDVECYGRGFTAELDRIIDDKRQRARPLSLAALEDRHLLLKLRDSAAWLLSPYL